MSIPTRCPECGYELLALNAGWKALYEFYIHARKQGKITNKSVIHIPEAIEDELYKLRPWDLGERAVGEIMTRGVRGYFLTMFGLQVRWGAPSLEITDARIVP